MNSPMLDYFGGAENLRKSIRAEIVESLQGPNGRTQYEGSNHFMHDRNGPSDHVIRAQRTMGKRRQHIYNYERDATRHLWIETIYCNFDTNTRYFARFDNGAMVMTINTNHHPILVKVLQSEMAFHWPEVTIKLEADREPSYRFPTHEAEAEAQIQPRGTYANVQRIMSYNSDMQAMEYTRQATVSPMPVTEWVGTWSTDEAMNIPARFYDSRFYDALTGTEESNE